MEWCNTKRGTGVAIFHKYYGEYEGKRFTASIGPIGVRRCKLCLWLMPYLYGNDIKFDISIKNKISKAIPYKWRLSGRDGPHTWYSSEHNEGKFPPNKKHKIINIGNPFRIGQYSLQIIMGDNVTNERAYTQIAAFTLVDRAMHSLNWARVLVSGLIGLIIGLIPFVINWIINGF